MRKLSKKISMLMVLAMLVSLFSGVVSASAASSWSFANKTDDVIVAVKETIEMEKNQFADFDLYKDGKAFDTDVYTVKYESSDADVVWVDAKNGKLRADKFGKAEAGDIATISALIENKNTGAKTTKSFKIEIAAEEVEVEYTMTVNFGDEVLVAGQKYDLAAVVTADGVEIEADVVFSIDGKEIEGAYAPAEAGEYTIVAVATVDGEEVKTVETKVVVEAAGLVSAKQTTYDTVALTFGSADVAKAVAADFSKLGSVYLIGENEYQAFVKSAAVSKTNAAVVNVTLFNSLMKDVTYKFTYGDKSATVVGVDTAKFSSMAIATTTVAAWQNQQVSVNLFNADGVLVQTVNTGFGLEAISSGSYNVPYSGTTIYFHEANKSATVKATYWMGYDENGVKIADLVATGTIVSIDGNETKISNINEWKLNNGNYGAGAVAKLAIGENGQLKFKFKVTNVHTGANWDETYEGNNQYLSNNNWVISFASTNEHVVLVDTTTTIGNFYPVGEGNAQIIVYRAKTWAPDNKEVFGIYNVQVVGNRLLTSVAPSWNKNLLSTAADDSVMVKPNAKDQLGADYNGNFYVKLITEDSNGVAITVNGTPINNASKTANNGKGVAVAVTPGNGGSGWAPYFTVKATAANGWATNVQFAITVEDTFNYSTKSSVVTLSAKTPGQIARYAFDGVSGAIDMNLVAAPWNGMGQFQTDIKLSAYDAAGYLVDVYDTDLKAGAANAVNGEIYYTVTRDGWKDMTGSYADNNFDAVSPTTVSGSSVTIAKYDKGTYTVTAYKKGTQDQFLVSTNIVVSDSTPSIVAVKKDNKVSGLTTGATTAQVLTALTSNDIAFTRNGNGVNVTMVDAQYSIIVNGTQLFVSKITVTETNSLGTFAYDVPVALTYTIVP